MSERWELVELIGQTLEERNIAASEQTVEAVLDSIEDLIRADQRKRTALANFVEQSYADMVRADLRAKVEALAIEHHYGGKHMWCVRRDSVLALIDRSNDD
jgi:hypothetical protein